jgi:hypothetical protein
VPSFEDTLRALNEIKAEEVISEYAIAGAMALVFWIEPVPTYDLDVLVFLPETTGPIVSLERIYEWARKRNYRIEKEHIVIGGIPVQFLPAHNEIADEAIETAVAMPYGGLTVRVVRPEYLIALYLEPSAKTLKRRERSAALLESGKVDTAALQTLLDRFKLAL